MTVAGYSQIVSPPRSTAFPLSFESITDYTATISNTTIASSVLVLVVTLLIAEQYYWRQRRGSLPGFKWQIVRVLPPRGERDRANLPFRTLVFLFPFSSFGMGSSFSLSSDSLRNPFILQWKLTSDVGPHSIQPWQPRLTSANPNRSGKKT